MSALWKDIVKDWENVPLESYKFLFGQAKERFDEVLSESVSITEKSINLTKVTIATLLGFVGYNFKVNPGFGWIVILSLLFLINLIFLGILMFPKGVIFKGSPTVEIFCEYLDNSNYTKDEKIIIVYYHELRRYQERIDKMIKKNSQRHIFYGSGLILTLVLIILTASAILSTIF